MLSSDLEAGWAEKELVGHCEMERRLQEHYINPAQTTSWLIEPVRGNNQGSPQNIWCTWFVGGVTKPRNLLHGSVYELWDSFSSSAHQGPDVPCRYAAQPGTVCSGCSHGGTLLLEHRADILGWALMGSVWIYVVGSTLLQFFHHLTYSSPHELDNEIWPSTDDY